MYLCHIRLAVAPKQGWPNALVGGVDLASNVHFQALVGSEDDARAAVLLEELSEDETGRTGADEEGLRADCGPFR